MLLPIVRSLGRRGVQVDVTWCDPTEPALKSRYINTLHEIPREGDGWLPALRELLTRRHYHLVIPATEHAVFLLQTFRNALDKWPIYLINAEAFKVCSDKRLTLDLAETLGIPVPRSYYSGRADQAANVTFEFPTVVKPTSSVRDQNLPTKSFVQTVGDDKQLRRYLQHLAEHRVDVVVQQFIPGRGIGVDVIADEGKILFALQHERLHETSGHGSTYRRSVEITPALLDATTALMNALNYTGVAMVEFRVDEYSGKWWLMEINARFWGSLPLAAAAGADFPLWLYCMLTAQERKFDQKYRVRVHCRSFTDDLIWWWRTLRRGKTQFNPEDEGALGWSVNEVPMAQLLVHLLRTISCFDHIDTFTFDDPHPWLYEVGQLWRRMMRQ